MTRLIDSSKSMEVVGTACSRSELLSDEAVADADVLLLDLDLAGESTANSLCSLRERCTGRVLVLTGTDDLEEHRRAVIRGARQHRTRRRIVHISRASRESQES